MNNGFQHYNYRLGGVAMWHRIKYISLLLIALLGIIFLSACGGNEVDATPTASAEEIESYVQVISATGEVIPAQWSTLSVAITGIIEEILVDEGDMVEEGQVLLRLKGAEMLEAEVAAAEIELEAAQQAYDDLFLYSDINKALARDALVAAQEALDDAEEDREKKDYDRASQETLDEARANLIIAEDAVTKKEIEYDQVDSRPEDDPIRAEKFAQLATTKKNRNRLEANLNWLLGLPDELEVARADVNLELAEAQVADAERDWEDIKADGVNNEDLALIEKQLDGAKSGLAAAQSALDDIELKAPFAGTISSLNVREDEWVIPGQAVMLLADFDSLRVETTDLNEIDMAQLEIDQRVSVTFDALPDLLIEGTLDYIAPKASEGSGVNYTAHIELDEIPEQLRWGMTAFVDIEVPE